MSNVEIEALEEIVAECVTEELNEWLASCSNEDIAVMLCVAKARKKAEASQLVRPDLSRLRRQG